MSEPGKKDQQRRDEKKEEMEKNEDRETKRWKQAQQISREMRQRQEASGRSVEEVSRAPEMGGSQSWEGTIQADGD